MWYRFDVLGRLIAFLSLAGTEQQTGPSHIMHILWNPPASASSSLLVTSLRLRD